MGGSPQESSGGTAHPDPERGQRNEVISFTYCFEVLLEPMNLPSN